MIRLWQAARPGRPRTHDEEAVAELLRTVLKKRPAVGTHWTVRSAAEVTGLSKSTVARMLALFGVQPHRSKRIMARIGRPRERELVLAAVERDELERIARSRAAAHGLVRRAEIILASAGDETNTSIARRLGITNPTICHWRKKWSEQGIAGLYGEASFKLSTDPLLVDKVKDIVGLYLNPPDHAVVLCVDEKSQIQALERTQPILPLGLGYRGHHPQLCPTWHHDTVCGP